MLNVLINFYEGKQNKTYRIVAQMKEENQKYRICRAAEQLVEMHKTVCARSEPNASHYGTF